MSRYTSQDTGLLQEAYSVQLLKEQAPHMTIREVQANLHLMTESELIYITTVNERIINEFWGGLKNVMGGVKNAAGQAAQGVKNVAGQAAQGVKSAAQNVGNMASAAGQGALAAGKQVAGNAANMYRKGEVNSQQTKALTDANNAVEELKRVIELARSNGVLSNSNIPIEDMTLTDIITDIQDAQTAAGMNAQSAQNKGFTGGAANAAKAAYGAARQPSPMGGAVTA